MGYGHANCQKCGEPTNVYPDVGEDESGILCNDCQAGAGAAPAPPAPAPVTP